MLCYFCVQLRCSVRLIGQLSETRLLPPAAVSIPEAPPGGYLEDRLEQQWAGAGGGGTYGYGGFIGGSGGAPLDSPSKYRWDCQGMLTQSSTFCLAAHGVAWQDGEPITLPVCQSGSPAVCLLCPVPSHPSQAGDAAVHRWAGGAARGVAQGV